MFKEPIKKEKFTHGYASIEAMVNRLYSEKATIKVVKYELVEHLKVKFITKMSKNVKVQTFEQMEGISL
jgi:hypothetical protein